MDVNDMYDAVCPNVEMFPSYTATNNMITSLLADPFNSHPQILGGGTFQGAYK